jgi:hypothetical protein
MRPFGPRTMAIKIGPRSNIAPPTPPINSLRAARASVLHTDQARASGAALHVTTGRVQAPAASAPANTDGAQEAVVGEAASEISILHRLVIDQEEIITEEET